MKDIFEPSTKQNCDEQWMREALIEARKCLRSASGSTLPDDVPVGAICVYQNRIIARAHNRRELDRNPIAHAETLCLQSAAQVLAQRHLNDVTLYVTLEPCPMCAGAIWLSRVSRVVFGAWDERAGACGSLFDLPRDPRLNHRPQVLAGVMQSECEAMLNEFFALRRS